MQFARIDLYAKENKISISKLMAISTLKQINQRKQVSCGFCRQPAIGKYQISVYDWDNGDQEKELNLCEFHLKKAKSEGEVKEV
jgi:hypothetical protein